MAAAVLWCAPNRSSAANWLDATSRLILACAAVCICFAEVGNNRLNKASSDAAFACVVVLMLVTVLRAAHSVLCKYADWRMERDSVPLQTVWTHILDSGLEDLAGHRESLEVDLPNHDDNSRNFHDSEEMVSQPYTEIVLLDSHSTTSDSVLPRSQPHFALRHTRGHILSLP